MSGQMDMNDGNKTIIIAYNKLDFRFTKLDFRL